jgi:hypothetical protein
MLHPFLLSRKQNGCHFQGGFLQHNFKTVSPIKWALITQATLKLRNKPKEALISDSLQRCQKCTLEKRPLTSGAGRTGYPYVEDWN